MNTKIEPIPREGDDPFAEFFPPLSPSLEQSTPKTSAQGSSRVAPKPPRQKRKPVSKAEVTTPDPSRVKHEQPVGDKPDQTEKLRFIKWDRRMEGRELSGKVVSFSATEGGTDYQQKEVGHIRIQTEQELLHINLTLAVLKSEFTEDQVRVGDQIKLVYEGERESKTPGRTFKAFTVQVADPEQRI